MQGLKNQLRTINIDSLFAKTHISSCDFVYELPIKINGVKQVQILSGNIPATSEPYLFLDIPELKHREIFGAYGKRYIAILRYELPATAEQNLIDLPPNNFITGYLGTLTQLTIKIYARWGLLHSFGLSKINVTSFSNASPTVITTSVAHNLVNGDTIYIREFSNASTLELQNTIQTTQYIVTVTGGTTFTIPLDLSGESPTQQDSGVLAAYTLGKNSEIKLQNIGYITTSYVAGPTGTLITTSGNHLISVGDIIKISGFDNGVTFSDNNKINSQHRVIAVPAANQIEISNILSSYPGTSQLTGTRPAYTLGLNSKIYPTKRQISFDINIISDDAIFKKKFPI
jgi:hypothetical protein